VAGSSAAIAESRGALTGLAVPDILSPFRLALPFWGGLEMPVHPGFAGSRRPPEIAVEVHRRTALARFSTGDEALA